MISRNSLSFNEPIPNTRRRVSSSNEWNTSIKSTGESCGLCCGRIVQIASTWLGTLLAMSEVNVLQRYHSTVSTIIQRYDVIAYMFYRRKPHIRSQCCDEEQEHNINERLEVRVMTSIFCPGLLSLIVRSIFILWWHWRFTGNGIPFFQTWMLHLPVEAPVTMRWLFWVDIT